MRNPVYVTAAGQIEILANGYANFFNWRCNLFTAGPVPPGFLVTFADFTLPTWAGYTDNGVNAFTDNFDPANDEPFVNLSDQFFVGPSSGPGQVALGWVMTNPAGNIPLLWGLFDVPVGFESAASILQFLIGATQLAAFFVVVCFPPSAASL